MIDAGTLVDGRYRVDTRLGSGGMADVYLARDELLGREIALKVLHQHFAEDTEFVERFRREASSAAALSHPNIVGIFDRGEWAGTYYIAMEYVAGRTLKSIVREGGAMEPAAAIDVVVQILRAARFAHKRGVIHRDLKPHNVILDEEGRARVTDFGIARAGASEMTLTGSIMGTAQYLSPEQAQGLAVTVAADVYSVGVILYELLTGSVPFEGETAVAIAYQQVAADPRPPSELNPRIPPELDAIVMRALAKDPAQRYGSADEFIAALERERGELPAQAPAQSPAPPPASPAPGAYAGGFVMAPMGDYREDPDPEGEDRRRLWWVLGGVLLAAIIAAVLLLLLLPGVKHVTVPHVRNETQQEADANLRRAGLTPAPTLASSATVGAGRVVSQNPTGGTVVEKGSRVGIVVSEGPASAALTDVQGLTAAQAVARLKAAGFKPTVRTEPSSTAAAGSVIGTEPPAGTETQVGSSVTVLVSSGPAPVKVPDVVGETQSAAEGTLSNAGLATGNVTKRPSSTQAAGIVLSQSPASGSSQRSGTGIDLVVAEAPAVVAVPDVLGESEALAAGALREAGLRPKAVSQSTTEQAQVGKVLTQTPSAGAHAKRGSTVTIAVGAMSTGTGTTTTTTPPASTTPAASPPAAAG
ncbi:MAG TPA: Stk1 family PASTA domain-containing Ser/Thr kinase [Solirubrobacteraceae bacterium]|jgi:serine/threonine-protein kinase|nr:Stk1 family PASTA domain-containing Ser/Thr kinase [Solirubrobacteraceae bacterium]